MPLAGERAFDPQKVAIYIRWSTDEQGQGTTLEVQKEACMYFCKSQGWAFREEMVFIDEGCSAGDLQRPALARLRAAVQDGQVECVVVYKLDRLSRNLLDCVTLVRQEWGGRCALYSTKENFDTHSPVGQMIFNILISFAEFERNMIRERTLSGKRKRAEQGRNAGQRYPYGYRKGENGGWALDGWDGERRCLTGPAAVVKRIFAEYGSGVGTVTLARRLNAEGIPGPCGGVLRFGAIIRILDNPIYVGTYAYGKQGSRGRGNAPPPRCLALGAVPPIVAQEEFQAVQRLRSERARRSPRSLHSNFLLSGIARCQQCGAVFTGCTGRGKRYYVCRSRAVKECDCAWIDADLLEGTFLAEVKQVMAGLGITQHMEQLQAEIEQWLALRSHAATVLRAQVAAIERRRERLDEAFFAGSLDAALYNGRALKLEEEFSQARAGLERAQAALKEVQGTTVRAGRLAGLVHGIDVWAELSFEEQKQLVRDMAASLTIFQARAALRCGRRTGSPLLIEWRPRVAAPPERG